MDGSRDVHELLLPLVDEENACLPLPVNVVSRYWNVELSIDEAAERARGYAGPAGSVMIEGLESAERHGLSCIIVHSSLEQLKQAIDAGIPPIVMLPGIPEITHHASVIAGYDEAEKTILHYVQKGTADGELQEGAIPEGVFARRWGQEGCLAILLAPPEALSKLGPGNESNQRANRLCFEAERAGMLGDPARALALLREAVGADPGNPGALYLLGAALGADSEESMKYYERCIAANPESYLAHAGAGNRHLRAGRFAEAEECYTRAISIDPGRSARPYKNRAYVRGQLGRDSEAGEDLRLYLKCYPRAPDRAAVEKALREI